MAQVYVRELSTRAVVRAIDVGQPGQIEHRLFMRGLLRNLNTERYFVDDTEVTWPEEARDPAISREAGPCY